MIRLKLSSRPEWLDLLPSLQLKVAPLTTALMVTARADPALSTLPETASTEDMALAMAKAVALAQALGVNTLIAAELLPEIEAVMVRKLNVQMEGRRNG